MTFVVAFVCAAPAAWAADGPRPEAERGRMDLTGWDFARDGDISLRGTWTFEQADAARMAAPGTEPAADAQPAPVPGRWTAILADGAPLAPQGAGIYRLKLKLARPGEGLGLSMARIFSAYCLWVDGIKHYCLGQPSLTPDGERMDNRRTLIRLPDRGAEIDLALVISNHITPVPGFGGQIFLGNYREVQAEFIGWIAYSGASVAMVLLFGVYHLAFWFRRRDNTYLRFAAFCFGMTVGGFHSSPLPGAIFPDMWPEWIIRLSLFGSACAVIAFSGLVVSLFPRYIPRAFLFTMYGLIGAIALSALTLPPMQFMHLFDVQGFLTAIAAVVAGFGTWRAWRAGEEGAGAFLITMILQSAAYVNGTLTYIGFDSLPPLSLFSLAITLILWSDILSRSSARAFAAAERLSFEKDAADRLAQARAQLIATVSHELRTPLNGFAGILRLLRDTKLDAQQRDYAQTLDIAKDALVDLIEELLDLTRAEAGQLVADQADFDLRPVIAAVEGLSSPAAADKGLALKVVVAEGVPSRVRGDGRRLRQVLLNLLSNAIKFTESGQVSLSVTADGSAGDTAHLLIFKIIDTGIGIPAEKLPSLFDPYVQAHGEASRAKGGLGLGLAIVKHVVLAMGGRISVDSQEGAGTQFTLTLPFEAARAPATGQAPTAAPRRSLAILVGEDVALNRRVIQGLLARAGHRPVVVEDGEAVLAKLSVETFDAVLLDLQMPRRDGFEALAAIRADSRIKDLPVFAVTADMTGPTRARVQAAGFNGLIAKPIDPDTLAAALIAAGGLEGNMPLATDGAQPMIRDDKRRAALASLLGEDEVQELEALFVDELARQTGQLTQALAAGDLARFQAAAHRLVSLCGNLGFEELNLLAQAAETAPSLAAATTLEPKLMAAKGRALEGLQRDGVAAVR